MALENIHDGRKTHRNIHAEGVGRFRKHIGGQDYDEIGRWVLDQFERQDWVNTTFIAPQTWSGTALQPIWDYWSGIADHAERHEQSAKLYGCVVYSVLFDRPETYLYHRPEGHHSDDARPFGLTYRRKDL